MKKTKVFYGWYIVAACMAVMAVSVGIVNNCCSLFVKPVCEELGFSRWEYGTVSMVQMSFGMLASILAGRIYARFPTMPFWRICSVLYAVGYFGYALSSRLWQFWACAVLVGFCGTFCTILPITRVINQWFVQRTGFAFGMACLGSGAGGMLFSLLTNRWIEKLGWRGAYMFQSVIMLAIMLVAVCLVVYERPSDKGEEAYGADDGDYSSVKVKAGMTLKEASSTFAMPAVCICAFLSAMCCSLYLQTITPHLLDIGYSADTAALVLSVSMAFMAAGKAMIGALADRLGIERTTYLAKLSTIVLFAGLLLARWQPMLGMIALGAMLSSAYDSVGHSLTVSRLFGNREHSGILGIVMACSSLGGVLCSVAAGAVYDKTGSYNLIYVAAMISAVVMLLLYRKAFADTQKEIL